MQHYKYYYVNLINWSVPDDRVNEGIHVYLFPVPHSFDRPDSTTFRIEVVRNR